MHRPVARIRLAAAALLALAAASPLRAQAAAAAAASPLERGLETIRAEKLLADVFFIAADEMRGRDTPSNEQRIAARFLRNRLQRLGFKPGAPDASFLFQYPLDGRELDSVATKLVAKADDESGEPLALELGKDWTFPFWQQADAEASGGVVFVGAGKRTEFKALDVAGKWALVWDPEGMTPQIAEAAKEAKAIGVIHASDPAGKGRDPAEAIARSSARLRRASVSYPGEGNRRGFPELVPDVMISNAARDRLLALAALETPKPGDDFGVILGLSRKIAAKPIPCEDVCGFWPGSDPKLANEVIICSAHYDHVGVGQDGQIFNGADDNGSGTCGLLGLAEALAAYGPLRRSVMLMWVSGEEKGLYGSRAWCDKPFLPGGAKPVADINMDMIGRNAANQILITPTKAHPAYNKLTQLAESFFAIEGFTDVKSADDYYTRSDHYNFAQIGIPITFLFDDVHADYHQPTDDPEKIDGDKMRRVVRVFLRMLDALQGDVLDLTIAKPAEPAPTPPAKKAQ